MNEPIKATEPQTTVVEESVHDILCAMLGVDADASMKELLKAAKKAGKKNNGNGQ